ncbi:hypothetical protein G3O08_00185 [Cryomorpha ignava]|uniref:PorT family protein n=1 Tax=Cryomorpha ignava TaxID=101383 RepID=A0A7K3WJU3_9FLAO|nr:hypothetical protein [Cryomorpha ignava]NEN21920.1 hypothetical protein [Cryomorpha ignava]
MKKMFTPKNTRIFILLFALPVLLVTNKVYGQNENGRFDFYLKANAGSLFNNNAEESLFKPQATACFGSHLVAKYSFNKLAVSTGIGADRLKFAQKLVFSHNPEGREYSTVEFSYFAWGIPILAHYSFADRFEIFGGVNIIAASWDSYGISAVSNRTSTLTASADEDIPNWQFTQEVMVGLNLKLSERFDLGIAVAKSLRNIEGMNVRMELLVPGQDDINISEKFEYSWTRVNIVLAYRLNK